LNPLIQAIINKRVNSVTADELFQQARQYQIPVSKNQAKRIASRVQGKNLDLFHPNGQLALRRILDDEIGPDLAEKLQQQFNKIIDQFH
jgi:hypothetical protein